MTPLIVRNSNEHTSTFDKSKISDSIYNEVNYVANELGLPPQITKLESEQVASNVENTIKQLNLEFLSGSTIRELASVELLKCGKSKPDSEYSAHRFYKRIGLPIAEAVRIDHGSSDSLVSNSNPVENPETAHKKKADAVSKEEMLLLLPHKLADGHITGDYHIHDSSYFTTRTFCMDHDLRFFFYYGLDPDCTGKTNIAGPAKNAEVAILHAAKILGSAQTNFAGGQGFYNFLTFLAPYLQDKSYNEIEQLMQMFIYEISQTMVARGAQVVFSSVQLSPGVPTIWKDIPVVYRGKVWDGDDNALLTYGQLEREVRLSFRAFMTVMLQGDVWGKAFNFPKPEIAFQKEFLIPHEEDDQFDDRLTIMEELRVWRPAYEALIPKREEKELPMTYSELYDLVFELTAKFGTPYFDNMIPAYRDTGGIECYQCLHGTEEVWLESGKISLKDLYNKCTDSNAETLEDSPSSKVLKIFDEKCLTTNGFRKFKGVRRVKSDSNLLFITTETNKRITCTKDHELFNVHGKVLASDLKVGEGILTSIRCKICGKELKQVSNTHLKTHNITLKQYIEKYGIEGTVSEQLNVTLKRKSNAMKNYWSYQPQEYIDEITQKRMAGFQEYWNTLSKEEKSEQKKEAAIGRWERMSDEMKRRTIAAPRKGNPHEPTETELLLEAELIKELPGSKIVLQKKVQNTTISKNAMPWKLDLCIDNKVAVECDGDYWHNLPHVIEKDQRKDSDLMEQGYIVVRLNNSEIKNNITASVQRVVEAVKANSRYEEISSIVELKNIDYVYDLVDVQETSSFITGNNIVSSNCCAFSFSADANSSNFQEKLNFTNGQHFSMGAAQVITLNFPRIAYNSKQNDFESLMENTRKLFDDAIQIQLIKRKWTNDAWKNGRIPFASQRITHPVTREVSPTLVDLDELVYIFGTIGLNEVALHHTGCDLTTPEGKNFTIRYYNHIKAYIEEQSKKHDIQLVLARTPAETTAQRFAVSDLLLYPELTKKYVSGDVTSALQDIHKTNDLPIYYSNGSHLPVDTNVNITEKISTESIFFTILDGGNIFHIWLGENSPDAAGLKEFALGIIKNTNIGYFAFTKDFTMCKDCKKQFAGLHDKCLNCDSDNVFGISRITGYIQSTENWNAGKKQELKDRHRISNF